MWKKLFFTSVSSHPHIPTPPFCKLVLMDVKNIISILTSDNINLKPLMKIKIFVR